MIKLIATDVDGTLIAAGESGPPKDLALIIEKLTQLGIIFVIASGRQYSNLRQVFKQVQDQVVLVAENGAYVALKGVEIYSNSIPWKVVNEIIKHSRSSELSNAYLVLCGKKAAYIQSTEERLIREVKKYYEYYMIVDDLMKVEDDILKCTVCDFSEIASNSWKHFSKLGSSEISLAIAGHIWLDILKKGVNKGEAIKTIQKKFGISRDQTMAFGDNFNDVEMLDNALYSYAMKCSPDGVKEHAKFIAACDEGEEVLRIIRKSVQLLV